MRRTRIIMMGALAALAGVAIPISFAWHWSQQLAVEAEQERLHLQAGHAMERAERTFRDASLALRSFAPLVDVPCSEAHIQRMRRTTVLTRSVDDIGYVDNGLLKCTSSGIEHALIKVNPPQFIMADGVGIDVDLHPSVSAGKKMVGIAYLSHKALIDPLRFADVILDPQTQLAVVANSGAILGALHNPDPALVRSLINRDGIGGNTNTFDRSIYALVRGDDMTAIVIEPRSKLEARLRNEQLILLPLGLIFAGMSVAAVIWLSRRRLSLRGELKIAVEQREFFVVYQPIIALQTGVCVGAEALIRWLRPDGSNIRPDLFIPVAEENDLIQPITDQVIDNVITDMRAALIADRELHIAINLCASDIETGRVLDILEKALAGTDIEPQQIWLEATERGFIDADAARITIEKARARGHAVAIDDFGTGYSSLSTLQHLPLDALKIDKSFVDTIATDAATSSVTPHIIDMARALNMRIVAEGIETQAQADYLLERQVEFGQGWLFAKALPAAEFLAFYEARRPR